MKKLSMTLSSPQVALTGGKGAVTASVTNGGEQSERVVLGAFPSDAPLAPPPAASGAATPPAAGAAAAPALGGAAPAPGAASAAWTTVDRPLRTIAPGATEQYEVRFDTAGAAPGSYPVKLIPYSADEAPEDYADLAHVVTLVVPAPEAPVAPKKRFPWWIPVAAAVLVLALGAVAFLLLRPDPVETSLTSFQPATGLHTTQTVVTLTGTFVEPVVAAAGDTQILAKKSKDDGTQYTFTMPSASRAGDVEVTVSSAGERIGVETFTYLAPAPEPELTSFAPNTGQNTTETVITLTGRFDEPVVARIGDTQIQITATAVPGDGSQYTFTMPPASRPGEALVSISSAGKDLGAQKFTYTAPPGPDPLPNFCERWPRLCIDINERSVFELPPQYELPRDVDVREEIIKPRIELELER